MSTLTDDTVRHYLSLPYGISLTRDDLEEERPWRAAVDEIPGCEARGATPGDAASRIPAALAEWVAIAQAEGREVPEPRPRNYSGKLLLRMSKSLHGELAQAAERDEVSLNAYVNLLLATALHGNALNGGPAARAAAIDQQAVEPIAPGDSARLHRFLVLALAANVAVTAIVATIAVILLVAA